MKSCAAGRADEAEAYVTKNENEFNDFTVQKDSRFTWDSGSNRKYIAQFENGQKAEATSKFFKTYQFGVDYVFGEATCKQEVLAICLKNGGGDHMRTIEEAWEYHRRYEDGVAIQVRKEEMKVKYPKPWQREVIELLGGQDNRKVLRVVNARGNIGKSWLVSYLQNLRPGKVFTCNPAKKYTDILHAFRSFGTSVDTILLDVPRTETESFDMTLIELFKNGVWLSTKYDCQQMVLPKSPALAILSNHHLGLHQLSRDRNITFEAWRNQTTGLVATHVREHSLEEYTNSKRDKGVPMFRCPRLDRYFHVEDVKINDPNSEEVPRLHADGFAECWCTGKTGYDLCGPLTEEEVVLYYQENGGRAGGHAPYAVCPPANARPKTPVNEPSDSPFQPPEAVVSPRNGAQTDSPAKPESIEWEDMDALLYEDTQPVDPATAYPNAATAYPDHTNYNQGYELPTHQLNDDGMCYRCGQVYPANQVCH